MIKGLICLTVLVGIAAAKCDSAKYTSSSFSTTDGFFHFQTTFIAEFTLQCANSQKDASYYAVVNGHIYNVAVSDETNKYQVSWAQEHDKSGSGTYNVNIFDEEGISQFKSNPSAKPIFTIDHYHAGLSRKSPVSSETVATLIAFAALYYAARQKSAIAN